MRWIVVALLVAVIVVPAVLFVVRHDVDPGPVRLPDTPAAGSGGQEAGSASTVAGSGTGGAGSRVDGAATGGRDGVGRGDQRGDRAAPYGVSANGRSPISRGSDGWSGSGDPSATGDGVAGSGTAGSGTGRAGGGGNGRNRSGSGGGSDSGGKSGDPAADVAGGQSVLLRVWAEGEQVDLEDLIVLRVPRLIRNAIHPGASITEHRIFPQPVASPIRLPARRGSFNYWAHAPGFAWRSIEVDHTDGGERLLTLSREPVTLQITLENYYPDSEAVVRIHHERPRGDGVELESAETIDVEGLPAGKYFIRVEIGDELWNSVLLGEREVAAEKGQLVTVTIPLDDPPDLEGQVTLGGTLELPVEWDSSVFAVRVQPLDVPTIQGQASVTVATSEMVSVNGVLEWSVGRVVPGRYRVLVEPLKLCLTADAREGTRAEVTLRVPPPCDVTVTVIDAETGTPVDLSRITWVPRGQLRGCQPMWEQRGAVGAPFSFVAPVGEIEISNLFVNDWRVDAKRFQLQAGVNDLIVEAEPACGVRIALVDGDTPLPLSDLPQSIQITAQNTSHRIVSWSSEGNWKVARLSGPDTFTVRLGDVRGFRPIPDQTFTVAEGEFHDLEIELVRE